MGSLKCYWRKYLSYSIYHASRRSRWYLHWDRDVDNPNEIRSFVRDPNEGGNANLTFENAPGGILYLCITRQKYSFSVTDPLVLGAHLEMHTKSHLCGKWRFRNISNIVKIGVFEYFRTVPRRQYSKELSYVSTPTKWLRPF